MEYRDFGRTGIRISRLGFGAMRLPTVEVDGKKVVDEDLAISMIHRAFEMGVNYIDTAWFYCDGQSEFTVGKALKGWRDRVYLSTKYPIGNEKSYRELLETQLRKLDTDHLDFYHFHGIGEWFLTHERHDEFVADAIKAKDEGLIRNISFSFHDKPEIMARIIDLGIFSSLLCQYNLLDRSNEDGLAYAKEQGLGTVVMGPVGGGRISGMPADVAAAMGVTVHSSAELALRFVFANPNVDCAISGMSAMSHVEENAAVAANTAPLSEDEKSRLIAALEENKRLADLYCTGCNYCVEHCPENVRIPDIFRAMNYYRIYGLKDYAAGIYRDIEAHPEKGHAADWCRECGECEDHCPQKIAIREQLKDCAEVFAQ